MMKNGHKINSSKPSVIRSLLPLHHTQYSSSVQLKRMKKKILYIIIKPETGQQTNKRPLILLLILLLFFSHCVQLKEQSIKVPEEETVVGGGESPSCGGMGIYKPFLGNQLLYPNNTHTHTQKKKSLIFFLSLFCSLSF